MIKQKEILDFLQSHKDEMARQFGIVSIGLFGSYARNEAGPESDIDLFVRFRERKFRTIAAAWNWLEEELGQRVDLIYDHPNLRPGLRAMIEKELIDG